MTALQFEKLLLMVSGTSTDVTGIAQSLARLESMVAQLIQQGTTSETPTNDRITLVELIDKFHEYKRTQARTKRGKPLRKSTLITYKVLSGFVTDFLHHLSTPNAPALVLSDRFAADFERYCFGRLASTTARASLIYLVSLSTFGFKQSLIPSASVITYKPAVAEPAPPAPLTPDELAKLENARFRKLRQQAVDCFLFCVYTGFHYIDGKLIDENAQQITPEGFEYLQIKRHKTDETAIVPYTEKARAIVAKYGGLDKLPFKANNTLNYHLKLAAKELGLNPDLKMSYARDTFADDATNRRGISDETLAAMLGHAGTSQVRKYRKVKVNRVAKEWKSKPLE